jgi:hypothetical protein
MTKKLPRRKKVRRAKARRSIFKITVESQPMVVTYEPRWLKSNYAHFEFRSPHKPVRRIPVSETGYLSHFASIEDVKDARGPQNFAREFVFTVLRSKQSRPEDPRQLALFQ